MARVSGNDVKSEGDIPESGWSNEHDSVPLKVRMKMLFAAKLALQLGALKSRTETIVKKENNHFDSEGGSRELSDPVMEDLSQDCARKGKAGSHSVDGSLVVRKMSHNVPERNAFNVGLTSFFGSSICIVEGLPQHCLQLDCYWQEKEFKPCGVLDAASADCLISSSSSSFLKVKAEPSDTNDLHCPDLNSVGNRPFNNTLSVKIELQTDDESFGDELDHMSLRDRIKLLVPGEASDLSDNKCLKKIECSFEDYCPIDTEHSKPIKVNRPRKKRRTVTDSIQTALEEDAPGLLQVLIDKGVLVDEIRLYGGLESDDALDDSLNEDNFSELEAVMSKLFSQHQSVLKFAPIRCKKGPKFTYCLPCLLSLVEQTRYLRFRKWPVEWGWCRDLQAFIFVFQRHNRIVLERPEYGYATYFFELVDSVPIDWQIKRLVVVMKLTSFSRITLIENKALLVGEDLSGGEAQVLAEYGWTPNSGLATMLNYCDRVVHDKWNEKEVSEWRAKIGKLLMDGYNGGLIVSTAN